MPASPNEAGTVASGLSSDVRLGRNGRKRSFWDVVEETLRLTFCGPLRAQAGPALDATQRRQQEAIEFASTCAAHEAFYVESIWGWRDGAVDQFFEQASDCLRAVRADIGDEMKRAISHSPSLPVRGLGETVVLAGEQVARASSEHFLRSEPCIYATTGREALAAPCRRWRIRDASSVSSCNESSLSTDRGAVTTSAPL